MCVCVYLCGIKTAGGRHLETSMETSLELTKMVSYLGEASKATSVSLRAGNIEQNHILTTLPAFTFGFEIFICK